MTQLRNIYGQVIHISGGRLYGVTNTGQQEYGAAETECGVNPSEHKPNQMLRGSAANSGYVLSKCFQASPSDG